MKTQRVRKFLASRRNRDERGAYMVLWALLLVALVTMAAIAIDLSSLRTDRRADRLVADAAVTAAAAKIDTTAGGRQTACSEAWTYIQDNLGQTATDPCPSVPWTASCDSTTAKQFAQGNIGSYNVTITTPVPNGDPLMAADAIGGGIQQGTAGADQAQSNSDGTQCQRVGVTITFTRKAFFGGIAGSNSGTTTVHSVARRVIGSAKIPANVVLLDPHDCNVLVQSGNAGEIKVTSSSAPPINGAVVVVSDATTGGHGSGACANSNTDAEVKAADTSPYGLNIDPGDLYLGAYKGSCSNYACIQSQLGSSIHINSPDGSVDTPKPLPSLAIDRTLVDYIFNCRQTYTHNTSSGVYLPTEYNAPRSSTVEQGPTASGGCSNASYNSSDWVNQYVGQVAFSSPQSAMFNGDTLVSKSGGACPASGASLTGDFDFNCNFPNNMVLTVTGDAKFENNTVPSGVTLTVTGNAEIIGPVKNPTNLTINGNAYFVNSAITLANGNTFSVSGGSSAYNMGSCPGWTGSVINTSVSTYSTTCVKASGNNFHTVFLDGGSSLSQTGGSLTLDHTFMYAGLSGTTGGATLSLGGGGTGSGLTWTPPSVGPFVEFSSPTAPKPSQLSLWSDAVGTTLGAGSDPATQTLTGGGPLNMSGVFYSPSACWNLTGNSAITNTATAQFIAYCLTQNGNSIFQLQPADNFIQIPIDNGPLLIR